MNIEELNPDERLALVALVKTVILADGHVSTEEVEELEDLVDALGEPAYQALLTEAERRFKTEKSMKDFLKTITGEDAREVILGTVMEMALSDSVDRSESELLDWLAETWEIEIQYEEPDA
ncbi:MAG: TerB family tellurite resistance protein [Deltaproteobacteria bacterium]|nr:TerB family tellurite resistance protein [Deltaproteobacteria bacterium]